jgi:hypothetical protein
MPENVRLQVADKLQQGVTIDKILSGIRSGIGTTMEIKHMVSKQDIHNIKQQFNIDGIERHDNDYICIQAWVEECRSLHHNSVVVFKQQGENQGSDIDNLSEKDFLLGIQTKFQEDMKRFGDNLICTDTTYNTNIYSFNLITVMVVDKYAEGIPVAWAITNREDMSMLFQFFKNLKTRTGDLKPKIFMTDDAEQFWKAWVGVYGANHTQKLLCAWHIDRVWREGLQKPIKNKQEQTSTYHQLQVLQHQQTVSDFNLKLQQFLSYCNRVSEWATCHHKWKSINTNMYVESFH